MGKFITDQILGMKWLNTLIGNLLGTLGLDVTSRIGGSIQFFLYDVIKITVLLCVLIYLMGHSLYGGWNLHRQVSTADSGVFESVRVCTGVDSNGDPHLGDDLSHDDEGRLP